MWRSSHARRLHSWHRRPSRATSIWGWRSSRASMQGSAAMPIFSRRCCGTSSTMRYVTFPRGPGCLFASQEARGICSCASRIRAGIPPELRARVLHRFVRADGSGTSGSGLGLAIIAEIVESHRGSFTFAERADGLGLIADVSLPLWKMRGVSSQNSPAPHA